MSFVGEGHLPSRLERFLLEGTRRLKKKISGCFTWSSSTWIKKVCVRGHKDEENLEVKLGTKSVNSWQLVFQSCNEDEKQSFTLT